MSGTKDMSDTLAEVFGTKVASAEDLEKTAQQEFFVGLCNEQGIKLAELSDKEVQQLWDVAMDMRKEAGEMPPQFAKKDEKGEKPGDKEGKEHEAKEKEKEAAAKEAAAVSEFNEKRAAAVKVAEADAMGRIMAHSFVEELNKITEKTAGFPFPPKKDGEEKGEKKKDGKDEEKGEKKEASSAEKAAALIASFQNKTAGVATAAGTSSMPNFDERAAWHAIEMLKTAGVDADEAFAKVNAAYTLGLKESVKVAAAADINAGLEIRALEICEAAGFAVTWA